MRLLRGVLLLSLVVWTGAAGEQTPPPEPPQAPAAPTPPANPGPPTPANPNQELNDRLAKEIAAKIAGREEQPAGEVFKNIQLPGLKEVPAGRLLLVMNLGYSRALGVACTHCHVEQDFASDDKRPKRAAREMAVMHRMINGELGKMQNLESKPKPTAINCSTCHRGAIDPTAADRQPK